MCLWEEKKTELRAVYQLKISVTKESNIKTRHFQTNKNFECLPPQTFSKVNNKGLS